MTLLSLFEHPKQICPKRYTNAGLDKSRFQWFTFSYSCFTLFCLLTCFHINIFVRVKQKISLREYKPFWHLSQFYDFAINAFANIFVHECLNIRESYSEPSRTSKAIFLQKEITANAFKYFCKNLEVRLGSEYVSRSSFPGIFNIFLEKEVLWGKNLSRIKEWIFANIWWDVAEQTEHSGILKFSELIIINLCK